MLDAVKRNEHDCNSYVCIYKCEGHLSESMFSCMPRTRLSITQNHHHEYHGSIGVSF